MLFDLGRSKFNPNQKSSVMKRLIFAALAACSLISSGCSKDFDNSTVTEFDLSRYLGEWYEVARYNHSFERGMDNTMAEYILQDDGKVVVLNTGWKDGKFKIAEGKAKYKDPEGDPGALKVSFFLFFYSEYNVMMVDENYQISLVGSKAEKYLWILSRTPVPDPDLLEMVLDEAEKRGYDTSELIWVDQSRNIAQWEKENAE
jgi:apolipoprotein D and lipocalin family protein